MHQKTRTFGWVLALGLCWFLAMPARSAIPVSAVEVAAPGTGTTGTQPGSADARDTPGGGDVLTFQNGDQLHGSLLSVEPQGSGLKWKSTEVETPVDFVMTHLNRVRLARKTAPESNAVQSMVRLSNGDELRGQVVSLDGTVLRLKTTYAGEISLQRAMLAQLWPGKAATTLIYKGPDDMTGWVSPDTDGQRVGWTVKNGQLISSPGFPYPIARDLKDLPDSAEIQFTAVAEGPYLSMNVSFCTDNLRSTGGNSYNLQFGGNSGRLYRYSNDSGSRNMGSNFQLDTTRNMPMQRTHMRILLNRQKKQVTLLINDSLIGQWTDPGGFPGSGKGLLFQCQDGTRVRIGGIKVSAWDGRIPQAGSDADTAGAEDTMVLTNGDKMSGKVASIAGKSLRFETSYAPLEIPLDRIVEVQFGKDGQQRARRNKRDIRCQFEGGGAVTLDLVSLNNGQIVGKSENFGDIKLATSALSIIEFSPWSKPEGDKSEPPEDSVELIDPFDMLE